MTDTANAQIRVNTPPAQTWNYLHVNDVAFELPAGAEASADGAARTNLGAAAENWIEAAAGGVEVHELAAGEAGRVLVENDGGARAVRILVGEGADAQIEIVAAPSGSELAGTLVELELGAGAHARVVGTYAAGDAPYLEGIGATLAEGASIELRQRVLDGHRSAIGALIDQAGRDSSVDVSTRYLVGGGEILDMGYTVRMRGQDTSCDMAFSGVLAEGAEKCLRDTIDLVHGAKGAAGNESETVLLAGGNLINRSLPTILCDEDDVAGNHGATIGPVSAEQLAYLSSRGLTADDVTELFSRAVFDDALAHAEAGRALVLERAAKLLGPIAAAELEERFSDAD